jgi:hypothetical protein
VVRRGEKDCLERWPMQGTGETWLSSGTRLPSGRIIDEIHVGSGGAGPPAGVAVRATLQPQGEAILFLQAGE